MALEQRMMQEQSAEPELQQLAPEDEESLEIMALLGKRLIDDGGAEVIEAAQNSRDPGQVIGQFLMQLGSQLVEELPEELSPSPAIFLAKGGWLEQMSDFLQEEYNVDRDTMDRAEIYVAQGAQDIADAQQAQQQPQAATQPIMPQGGMLGG